MALKSSDQGWVVSLPFFCYTSPMLTSKEYAFPSAQLIGGASTVTGCKGMTKREVFAAHMLQAIVSNEVITVTPAGFKAAAKKAIQYADALIEELG